MSFIHRTLPPPVLEIGQTLPTTIIDLSYPVTSPANNKYPQRDQVQFTLQLDDGYRFKTWITYYDQPHEHSDIGTLCMTYMETTKHYPSTVDDTLDAIKEFGQVYVQCVGHNDRRDVQYPKLKLVCDRLPGTQTTMPPDIPIEPKLTPKQAENLKRQLREAGYQQ